jgi:hypothetical protein
MSSLGPAPNSKPCPISKFFFFIRASFTAKKSLDGAKKKLDLELNFFFSLEERFVVPKEAWKELKEPS